MTREPAPAHNPSVPACIGKTLPGGGPIVHYEIVDDQQVITRPEAVPGFAGALIHARALIQKALNTIQVVDGARTLADFTGAVVDLGQVYQLLYPFAFGISPDSAQTRKKLDLLMRSGQLLSPISGQAATPSRIITLRRVNEDLSSI